MRSKALYVYVYGCSNVAQLEKKYFLKKKIRMIFKKLCFKKSYLFKIKFLSPFKKFNSVKKNSSVKK